MAGFQQKKSMIIKYLNYENLEEIPEEILKDLSIGKLYLKRNLLKTLPSGIYHMSNLIEINLDSNKIEDLPNEMKYLRNLEILDLKQNYLKFIPECIYELSKLKILNLYLNEVNFVGKGIGKLKKLKTLNLSSNQVKYLPNELFECSNLINLHLDSNKLNYIPQQIIKLQQLNELSICCNNLSFLNLNIGAMKKLKSIAFFQNKQLWYFDISSILSTCAHYSACLKNLTPEEESQCISYVKRYYNLLLTEKTNSVPPLLEIVLRQIRIKFRFLNCHLENQIPNDLFTTFECPPGLCCYCEQPLYVWAIYSTAGIDGFLNIFCSVACLEDFYVVIFNRR